MAAPSTPELEKSKLSEPSSTMASSQLSTMPQKVAVEQEQKLQQAQNIGALPPTPKATPAADAATDSFDDEHDANNELAAKKSIESLATGQNPTADFVPDWHTTKDGSSANVAHTPTGGLQSVSRLSRPELHAANSLVQLPFSPIGFAVPQQERPCLSHPAPQSLESRKRRTSQLESTSRPSEPAAHLPGGQSASHQAPATSALVSTSLRKAGLVAHHIGKAKTDEFYDSFCCCDSSSRGNAPKTVKPITGSTLRAWFDKLNTLDGREEHWQEQRDIDAKYCRLHSLAGEIKQAESTSKSKPTPRSKAVKASKKPASNHAGPDEVRPRRSRFSRGDALQGHFPFTPDYTLSRSGGGSESEGEGESEFEFFDQPPVERTKIAGGKTRRALEEQDELFGGFVPAKTKTAGAKRKRLVDEPGRSSNGAVPKKRKLGVRGIGEGKVKSKKDKRLGDIKHWLDSKTKKYQPGKKHGDPPTPLHKSDYEALEFVRLPQWGSEIDAVEIEGDEKLAPKGEYHGGDPKGLHPKEQAVAKANNLSYDDYRCQKRRVFAARAVFDVIYKREKLAFSWGRTQTQLVGSIDANKSSFLFSNFNKWGWFDTMEAEWDEHYLKTLVADFDAYDPKTLWTPPSNDR